MILNYVNIDMNLSFDKEWEETKNEISKVENRRINS